MKYTDKIRKEFNTIIEKNVAAHKGYETAAEKVTNNDFKQFFTNQSKQRENFIESLRKEMNSFGVDPKIQTDLSSDLHRNWMKVKEFLSSNNEEAMIEEVIRGEESSLETYNNVLEDTELPKTSSEVIRKQRNFILDTLEKLRSFEMEVA